GKRDLQDLSDKKDYPGGTIETCKSIAFQEGECVIFVDGLRFDAAKQLSEMLGGRGCIVEEQLVWAALPSVTSTGKAAASPVRRRIFGKEFDADFDPCVAETGQSLKGGYHLKKLLNAEGWKVLGESEDGDGNGNGWCEFGDIDHSGHEWGWKLARNLDGILREIVEKTAALLRRGWKNVRIVTDHGWLLLPGGLPKTELSSALTESKWGRCAVMKEGASTKERMFPWFWNRNFLFALADGVGDFRKGEEYAHGGLSLQECLLLELKVFPAAEKRGGLVEITDIVWKGMRCVIAVEGAAEGLSADIRKEAGNPASSVVASVRGLKEDGMASVVVVGDELEGSAAFIVLLDADGEITAQIETTIGGGKK
ncbi:MAG: PglZ domain-containing protein, partial [Deltaproteobacteria bacterium]|nr:PglZ domain-containing protein [Deltaproteobacteria bacterium]